MYVNDSKTKEELLQEVENLRREIENLRHAKLTSEQRDARSEELQVVSTEMQRIQQELQAKETFLEAIIENLPDMIFVKDAQELRFVRFNKAGLELLGYDLDELIGKNDYDLFPAEEADFFTQKDHEVLRKGCMEEIHEEPIKTRHKGTRYLHTKKVPILDPENGDPLFLLGISQDITEQKKMREELRSYYDDLERRVAERTEELSRANKLLQKDIEERLKTEARLNASEELNRRIVESLPGGVFHFSAEGEILQANQKALDFFQRTADELPSLSLSVLERRMVWEDGCPCRPQEAPARRTLETGMQHGPITLGLQRSDGSLSWAIFTAVPIFHPCTQDVIGVVLTFLDITERKQQEEERKEFEAKLRQAQKLESLGVLAGGIAHDFNNLLVGILGNADLALDSISTNHKAYRWLEQIRATALQASELTRQMLAYSGRGKFQMQSIHLSDLAMNVSDLLQAAIPRNVLLETDLPQNLPLFEGDPSQVQQVLMNLLINAAESYMGKAGTVTVRTGHTEWNRPGVIDTITGHEIAVGSYVFLEVADQGCGMDEETQSKLFEPFYTTKFTGRGLGLAAVLGIMRGHGGMIKISSEPQRGTIITVFFPASAQQLLSTSSEEITSNNNLPLSQWEGAMVLVIDDDPVVRLVIRNMLKRLGLRPLLANDGLEGLALFARHADTIAVVILDLTMPRMGGEEAFLAMKKIRPDTPFILCSGYNQEEAFQSFAESDISGFLKKPFTLQSLHQKLQQALVESIDTISEIALHEVKY